MKDGARGKSNENGTFKPVNVGTTRERILHLLKTKGRMNASELSQQLGLTEMAVRRHIYELEREGSVNIVPVRQAMGRPLHTFELTAGSDELFPKNYHVLTMDLLAELEEHPDTKPLIDHMFEGRMRKLHDRYAPRMAGKDLEQRVKELADIQNSGGYMVEMEHQSGDSYMLYEYNCPIKQVAGKYEQACRCELSLFRSLLEASVERTECLAKGGGRCSYSISAFHSASTGNH